MLSVPHAALRARAAELARAAAWAELATFLGERPAAREVAELVPLRAESLMLTGRPCEARAWLAETMGGLARRRERAALRKAHNLLGAAHFALGELEAASCAFSTALELGRDDADDLTVARATNNLGAIANVRGDRARALSLYQLAIPAYQRLGSALGLAQTYHNMAISLRDLGQYTRADDCERRAIEHARRAESPRLVALALLGRADLSLRSGDAALAEAGARRAADSFDALRDPINAADARRVVGAALLAQRRLDAARDALDDALRLARAHGSALHEAETLRTLAELHAARGDVSASLRAGWEALAVFDRLAAVAESAQLRDWLARHLGT
jgi:tetratricopeptide (TPR) repeat protein